MNQGPPDSLWQKVYADFQTRIPKIPLFSCSDLYGNFFVRIELNYSLVVPIRCYGQPQRIGTRLLNYFHQFQSWHRLEKKIHQPERA